jgi:hypothetical protein
MKGIIVLGFALTVLSQQTIYGQCKTSTPSAAIVDLLLTYLLFKVVALAGTVQPSVKLVHAAVIKILGTLNAFQGTAW